MKRVWFILVGLVCLVAPARAQDRYLELFRADLRAQKTAILTENLKLTDDEAAKFWPIYREYDVKRAALEDERLGFLKDYVTAYDNIGPEMCMTLMEKAFSLEEQRMKLRKQTFEKVAKTVDPVVAARWAHLESMIQHFVDLQIQMRVPLAPLAGKPAHSGTGQ
jgi:hypothetical protein